MTFKSYLFSYPQPMVRLCPHADETIPTTHANREKLLLCDGTLQYQKAVASHFGKGHQSACIMTFCADKYGGNNI